MEIQLTKHANDKIVLLGIILEQIKECLQRGAKTKQTDGYLSNYAYLRVAYKIKPDGTFKIKTVFIG